MAITINELKWRSLTNAIQQIKAAPRFLQDMVFKKAAPRPSEYVDVDIVVGGRTIAPFVGESEGAIVVDKLGREMRSIKVPRTRLKKPLNAAELLTTRAPGSPIYIGSNANVNSYRKQKIGQELKDLKDNFIGTRTEWMCAGALAGGYTVTQDNLKFSIDFQMPDAHKPDLSGDSAKKWNGTGPDILGNIDTWSDLITNAIGMGPNIAICGSDVVKAIRGDTDVVAALDNRRKEAGSLVYDANSNYIGNLNGIDLYRYGLKYTDTSGSQQNLIPDDVFILISTAARLTIEYARILDLDAEASVVTEIFSKAYTEKDPSVLWLLAESRPLPVPWQPEAIVYATVTG